MLVSDVSRPVPGLYKIKLVKGKPNQGEGAVWSAVKIWDSAEREEVTGDLLEDECFHCLINGREVNPEWYAERVNCFGEPIDQAEYEYILSVNGWAAEHAPEAPEADPSKSVDLTNIPPITP